jgi:hypothetical protein
METLGISQCGGSTYWALVWQLLGGRRVEKEGGGEGGLLHLPPQTSPHDLPLLIMRGGRGRIEGRQVGIGRVGIDRKLGGIVKNQSG